MQHWVIHRAFSCTTILVHVKNRLHWMTRRLSLKVQYNFCFYNTLCYICCLFYNNSPHCRSSSLDGPVCDRKMFFWRLVYMSVTGRCSSRGLFTIAIFVTIATAIFSLWWMWTSRLVRNVKANNDIRRTFVINHSFTCFRRRKLH